MPGWRVKKGEVMRSSCRHDRATSDTRTGERLDCRQARGWAVRGGGGSGGAVRRDERVGVVRWSGVCLCEC